MSSHQSSLGKMRSSGSPTGTTQQNQYQTSTAQYKKVLEKGGLCGGKVLDDNDDDDDEDYEDDDFDEKSPAVQMAHGSARKLDM